MLAVLVIFIVGMIPAALAEEAVDTAKKENKKIGLHMSDDVKKVNQEKRLIAQNKELNGSQKRVAIQKLNEKRKKLREQFLGIKANYAKAKKDYKGSKDKVIEWKKKVKDCKETNCSAKKEYRKHARKNLMHLSDVILENLNKLQNRVEDSDMDSIEKTELLAKVKAQIEEIKKAKTTLENKSEATDEEIKAAVQSIKKSWSKTKPLMKRGAGNLVNAKLGNLVVKIEQLEKQFTAARDRLKAKGQDTTKLDAALKSFKAKLAEAKKNWNLAKTKFKEAKTAQDTNKAIKEAHALQKKARDSIKDIKKDLREILKELKGELKDKKAAEKAKVEEKKAKSDKAVVIS